MRQKISAFYYIKNNKRRVSVLVVSLSMFFVVTYISMFILSTTTVTFKSVLTETTKHIDYMFLHNNDLGMVDDGNQDSEIYDEAISRRMEAVRKKYDEIAAALEGYDGIEDVFMAEVVYAELNSIVGHYSIEIPLVNSEQMSNMLEHMGAKLVEGRLPQEANEVVLDKKLMKNHGYKIGNTGDKQDDNDSVKIVGIIDCDYYFGCGLSGKDIQQDNYINPNICVLTDGTVNSLKKALKEQGIVLEYSEFYDLEKGEEELQTEVIDVISESTNLLFIGIIVIVSVLVIIVNISYMRDRRSEWCLYASIGYSRRTIYYSILRELLFTFVFSLFVSVIICVALMKILDIVMITELGLKCSYFMPDTLVEILCTYVLLFGLIQIPIRVAMYKIKTIDAIDDDM